MKRHLIIQMSFFYTFEKNNKSFHNEHFVKKYILLNKYFFQNKQHEK